MTAVNNFRILDKSIVIICC